MNRVTCVFLVALLAGCASNSGPTVSAPTPSAPPESMRSAQLLQMTDLRRLDTALVDAVLGDANNAVRAKGALAVGQVKMRARYAKLRQLLSDADTAVAANAAYALGIAHDTGSVTALARALVSAPSVVSREIAWSLGEIGEPARAVIVVALGDGLAQPLTRSTAAARSPSTRAALLMSSGKLRPIPVATISPWLADPSPEVVRAAAYAIGRNRVPGGVRALLTVKAYPDDETRQHVARGLAKAATGDSLASAAREALAAMITDASPRVRMNAVRSLASFGPTVSKDFDRALNDASENVRVAATEAIATVYARDTAAWRRAWSRDTSFRVRQQLLTGARSAGTATLAFAEADWSKQNDWRKRVAALEARAADTKADRVALAREFSRDADGRVRSSALSLIPASGSDAEARALATPLLTDNDPQVRAAALTILARRARAADVEAGVAGFERAAKDVDADARVAALRVIAAAWSRDSGKVDERGKRRLSGVTGNATNAERRIVANVSPMSLWAKAEIQTPPRALSDYERLVRRWDAPGARQPTAVIHTDRGDITLELFGADAPLIVESFIRLANNGYYRNSFFHRVVPNFVVQDGDQRGDGSGSPGFTLRESYSRRRHERGAVGLATSGPDTGGSQYYLTHSSQPHLDGGYTVFGRVIDGFEVLDAIVQGDRMLRIDIK